MASTGLGLSGRGDGAGVRANCNVELSFPALFRRSLSQVALYLYLFKPVMVQLFYSHDVILVLQSVESVGQALNGDGKVLNDVGKALRGTGCSLEGCRSLYDTKSLGVPYL